MYYTFHRLECKILSTSGEHLSSLLLAVSQERLEPYKRQEDADDLEAFGRYVWNMQISEALYPALQGLEITLRNSIHDAATDAFGYEYWMDGEQSPLKNHEQKSVRTAKRRLQGKGKEITPGRLVAELNFGFWTSLLYSRYEQVLWPKLNKSAFPHVPRRMRNRKSLDKRFNSIRFLRNRVFHYEPIWHWNDLTQQHTDLLDTIGWISPAARSTVKVMDRFSEVYEQGHKPCRDRLTTLIHELDQQ